jgi:BolA family transcriptional regulator, general stress-responsive regulator
MSPIDRTALIEKRLQEAFSPTYLKVINESDQHIGHAGHQGGNRHFAVEISAAAFHTMTRVAAHQAIYQLFTDMMPDEIHALRIKVIK